MWEKRVLLSLFLALLLFQTVTAQQYEQVIANSADWRDVYSTIIFGKLNGYQTNFLVGQPHAQILLFSIPQDRNVLIVSSSRNSYALGYKSLFDNAGYTDIEEMLSSSINLDLAKRLTSINNYIILDDSYGYNSISVGPYAIASKSYVLFVDSRNINDVENFLQAKNVGKVLLYGELDREVRTRLAQFNPETINQGDRYLNNVEVVKKFMAIKSTQQVLLSNGEFIEDQLLSGDEPVLFIGNNNVPEAIAAYIRTSSIKVGVLVGNELISTATTIRRQLGISVFVKFAQSARVPGGAVANVEDLDRFPLPRYALSLSLTSVKYNEVTKQLEVTYHNNVDQGTYFKGTILVRSDSGTQTVGDLEPLFIDGNEFRTVVYPFEEALLGDISAEIFTLFGESKRSFEYSLRSTVMVDRVSVNDDTSLEIVDLKFSKGRNEFTITVKNTGIIDTYTNLEIVDLIVNAEPKSFGSKGETLVPVGKSAKIKIKVDKKLLRPSDSISKIPNDRKFRKMTGWRPEFTLEQSLSDLLDWWRARL